nr:alpha carbonic anhydrase 7-like [Tanacetum cinerariifolium]
QNVIWTIVNKVRTVSREQLHAIREAVHDHAEVNSRPIQSRATLGSSKYRRKNRSGGYHVQNWSTRFSFIIDGTIF